MFCLVFEVMALKRLAVDVRGDKVHLQVNEVVEVLLVIFAQLESYSIYNLMTQSRKVQDFTSFQRKLHVN